MSLGKCVLHSNLEHEEISPLLWRGGVRGLGRTLPVLAHRCSSSWGITPLPQPVKAGSQYGSCKGSSYSCTGGVAGRGQATMVGWGAVGSRATTSCPWLGKHYWQERFYLTLSFMPILFLVRLSKASCSLFLYLILWPSLPRCLYHSSFIPLFPKHLKTQLKINLCCGESVFPLKECNKEEIEVIMCDTLMSVMQRWPSGSEFGDFAMRG